MKHLIKKVVIFTLKNNLKINGLVEGVYKNNLILKIPINITYINHKRLPNAIELAISNVNEGLANKEVDTTFYYTNGSESRYVKKEFSYYMLPIENILIYEITKEDLINIITKE